MFHKSFNGWFFFCLACLGLVSACARPNPAANGDAAPVITVMAAASLAEPFEEIGLLFEQQHPGSRADFNLAGSQQLVQQLAEGAPADVFASANQKQMDNAAAAGRIDPGSSRPFVLNRLVVILPKDNPAGISTLPDLARPGIKLVLAAEEVPVGQYSLEFLARASREGGFGAGYQDKVLQNVVSYENNVKSVLAKVSLGEADAGVVYTSDAGGENLQIRTIEIPGELNIIATYPIAPVKDSPNPELSQAFIDLVFSEDGQQILEKYGFIPVSE